MRSRDVVYCFPLVSSVLCDETLQILLCACLRLEWMCTMQHNFIIGCFWLLCQHAGGVNVGSSVSESYRNGQKNTCNPTSGRCAEAVQLFDQPPSSPDGVYCQCPSASTQCSNMHFHFLKSKLKSHFKRGDKCLSLLLGRHSTPSTFRSQDRSSWSEVRVKMQ